MKTPLNIQVNYFLEKKNRNPTYPNNQLYIET